MIVSGVPCQESSQEDPYLSGEECFTSLQDLENGVGEWDKDWGLHHTLVQNVGTFRRHL